MKHFDRRITVTVDTVRFTSLDCSFSVRKSIKPEPNTCELTVWNLTEEHRAQLEGLAKAAGPATSGIGCQIDAGYEDGTSTIWLGDLRTCESIIDGPDIMTVMSSGDGEKAWRHARQHVSYGPKTPILTVLRALARELRELGVGEGNLWQVANRMRIAGSAVFPVGKVISGSAAREIVNLCRSAGVEVSIQDGALFLADQGQPNPTGQVLLVSEGAGMLGSPRVDADGLMTVTMRMSPGITVGNVVVVKSKRTNGAYRIEAATWTGDTRTNDWHIEIEGKPF